MSQFLVLFKESPKKYLTLLSGLIYLIPAGSIGVTGTASPYYMSYLQNKTHSGLARYPNTIYLLTLQLVFNACGAVMVGLIMTKLKISLKRMAFVGPILISFSYVISYFTLQYSFILFCISFGLIFGLGLGFSFIIPFSIVTKWFPESKGMVSSFIFIGSGIGSTLFPEFSTLFCNPKDYSPEKPYSNQFPDEKYFTDADLLKKVPYSFLYMGFMTAGLYIIALSIMFVREDNEISEENSLLVNSELDSALFEEASKPVMSLSDALRTKNVYLLIFMNICTLIPMNLFNVNYKNYGQTFIKDDQFLTLINSVGSIVNIPGRLIWGVMIDRMCFKETYLVINSSNMVILFTVCFNEYFGNKYSYMFYFILTDLLICGALLILPQVYVKCFGHKNMFLIHGLVQFFSIPGQFLQSAVAPIIIENFGYFGLFSSINIFALIAWMCTVLFDAKDNHGKDV